MIVLIHKNTVNIAVDVKSLLTNKGDIKRIAS